MADAMHNHHHHESYQPPSYQDVIAPQIVCIEPPPFVQQPGPCVHQFNSANYHAPSGQHQTVVLNSITPVVSQPYYYRRRRPIYEQLPAVMVLSCIAFWFCGVFFGLAAFILAMYAEKARSRGDYARASRLGSVALGLATAGLMTGMLTLMIAVPVSLTMSFNAQHNFPS